MRKKGLNLMQITTMIRGVGRKAFSVARLGSFLPNYSRPFVQENGPGLKGLQELAQFNSPLGLSAGSFSGVRGIVHFATSCLLAVSIIIFVSEVMYGSVVWLKNNVFSVFFVR